VSTPVAENGDFVARNGDFVAEAIVAENGNKVA